jgi:HSP20 family protein
MADQSTQSPENRPLARYSDALSPFAPLRQMERLFEDFFGVFGPPTRGDDRAGQLPAGVVAPRIDVSETDNEIRITAELPGLQEKDVDLTLRDDVLTIRGEAKTEREEKKQDYHVMERARGTFVRALHLPFSIDANRVQAAFKDGVLNITIPKPQEMKEKVQRIEVKRDEGAQQGGSQRSPSGAQSSAEAKVPETAAE